VQPKNIYFLIFFLTNIFLISLFSTATAQTPPSEADCRYCHENINPAIKISTIHHDKTDTIIPNPTDAPYGTPGNTFECISCHATRPVCGKVTYIIETDCVACHATTDLHHTPVPTSCNSCHEVDRPADPHQQGLDCSDCHFDPGGLWYDHTPTPSTCNECHEDTRPADPHPATRDCSECHTGIGTTWTEATYDHTPASQYCASCHEVDRPADPHQQGLDCSYCHFDPGGLWYDHTPAPTSCNACHESTRPADPHPQTRDCSECHLNTGNSWLGVTFDHIPAPTSCALCHESTRPVIPHPQTKDCTVCHADPGGTWLDHVGVTGSGCQECHGHDAGYEFLPGQFSLGAGTFAIHSTHTENDADDLKGPNISCAECHDTANYPNFSSGTDNDNDGMYSLFETDVCDTCHSPGGNYNGVSSVNDSVGAKDNWATGVYAGTILQSGKEMWCVGCHDDAPANSKVDGSGVSARNVTGDSATYGYYETGHGKNTQIDCLQCHSANMSHIDHLYIPVGEISNRTTLTANPTNYRFYAGKGLSLPRYPGEAANFTLCFTCHDDILLNNWYGSTTNFMLNRSHLSIPNYNLHMKHESQANCVFCHDPHGTTAPRMTVDERTGTFKLLILGDDEKYYELADPGLWDDPIENVGGAITTAPDCRNCHSPTTVTTEDHDTPVGLAGLPDDTGWYIRDLLNVSYIVSTDTDIDGVLEAEDNCPCDYNSGQEDADADNIGDVCDNSPNDYNPLQEDRDRDGLGDVSDACLDDPDNDIDEDGVCGDIDNCPQTYNPDQTESDTDGLGDACDNCPDIDNAGQEDADLDGEGDACEMSCSTFDRIWSVYSGTDQPDEFKDLALDGAGNIYAVGQTRGDYAGLNQDPTHSTLDSFVVKFNPSGDILWAKQFGTPERDHMLGIAVNTFGKVYVTGYTMGFMGDNEITANQGQRDIFLTQLDASDGALGWSRQVGSTSGDTGNDVAVDSLGNVYVAGEVSGAVPGITYYGNMDIIVIKYDAAGNKQWAKQYGTLYFDTAFSISVEAGNVYVAGSTQQQMGDAHYGSSDCIILQLDPADGTQLLAEQIGTPASDSITDMVVDGSSLYITGETYGAFPGFTNQGNNDIFVSKLNTSDLSPVFINQLGSSGRDYSTGIDVDSSANIYFSGYTDGDWLAPPLQYRDIIILGFDSAGELQRGKQLRVNGWDSGYAIKVDSNGDIYVAGGSTGEIDGVSPSTGYGDFLLLKETNCTSP
jgi:hypothetical protein